MAEVLGRKRHCEANMERRTPNTLELEQQRTIELGAEGTGLLSVDSGAGAYVLVNGCNPAAVRTVAGT